MSPSDCLFVPSGYEVVVAVLKLVTVAIVMTYSLNANRHKKRIMLFGSEVRQRRRALGLSLEELGARTSISANFIGGIELGRRNPSLTVVLSLAQGLGVAVGELLSGSPNLSSGSTEMGGLFAFVPADLQEVVLDILRFTVGRSHGQASKESARHRGTTRARAAGAWLRSPR